MSYLFDAAVSITGLGTGPIETIVLSVVAYTLFLVLLDAIMRVMETFAGLCAKNVKE